MVRETYSSGDRNIEGIDADTQPGVKGKSMEKAKESLLAHCLYALIPQLIRQRAWRGEEVGGNIIGHAARTDQRIGLVPRHQGLRLLSRQDALLDVSATGISDGLREGYTSSLTACPGWTSHWRLGNAPRQPTSPCS